MPVDRNLPDMSMREIMMRFESLGENCEFGLAQRHHKAEPLSLFRWASAPLANVIAALDARLDQFGHPDSLHIRLAPNGEYMADETRYRISYHTWAREDDMTPEVLHERECKRLRYLSTKLLDDLREADKIFVCQRSAPLAEADIMPLHRALKAYGPNKLLWITPEDEGHPSGCVELTEVGLIHGYIDHFANPARVPATTSVQAWSDICANAWRLSGV
jgi:hypothetical protein